jgi:uncharacterized membrane protein YfcA
MSPSAALLVIVCAAFAVETALGFGATVIVVALGSLVTDLRALLVSFVPVNLTLSLYLSARYRHDIDVPTLTRRIAPWMLAGVPVGLILARSLDERTLKAVFGVFVCALAAVELIRMRRAETVTAGIAPWRAGALLTLAGVIHGAFATGGPLVVYVTSREITDKARFRSTLSALWLVLNAILVGVWWFEGRVGRQSLGVTFALVPSLVGGVVFGEVMHRRVPDRAFRVVVYVALLAVGAVLVAKR